MRADEPLVSIGLPVFDGERYLGGAIDSVLAQDLGDLELILCDNASTDGTAEICRAYVARDPRVRYEGSPENRGAAWNYNRAVGLARGRYFRWMTHDDRISPECVRLCLDALREGAPDVVLAYPRTVLIDADDTVVGDYDDGAACLSPRPHERVGKLLQNLVLCNPVVGLIPLEILRTTRLIGPWRGSDRTLLLEIAMRGKIVEVQGATFFRRRDERLPSPSNMDARQRALWFDTSVEASDAFRWRLLRETFRAVALGPASTGARLRCHLSVLRHAIRQRRHLLREATAGLRAGPRTARLGVE